MEQTHYLSSSDRHWFELIQQCRTSGKSDAQWMQEHEIKPPTFYYHVKQLRKKACDIPKNCCSRQRNEVQEVVPLFIAETPSIITNSNPPVSSSITEQAAAVRLNIQGITVEIGNSATQEVIKNTISALQFLC